MKTTTATTPQTNDSALSPVISPQMIRKGPQTNQPDSVRETGGGGRGVPLEDKARVVAFASLASWLCRKGRLLLKEDTILILASSNFSQLAKSINRIILRAHREQAEWPQPRRVWRSRIVRSG
jgi:hypothetical protein